MRGRKPVQDKSLCKMARLTTVQQARALRRNAPETERLLWKLLRDRKLEGSGDRSRSGLTFWTSSVCAIVW